MNGKSIAGMIYDESKAQFTNEKLQELRDRVMGVDCGDMPELRPGMMARISLVSYLSKWMMISKVDQDSIDCIGVTDGDVRQEVPKSRIMELMETGHMEPSSKDSAWFKCKTIWTRPVSQYRKILQPEIDKMDAMLCDGTGYETGRLRGQVEGMRMALEKLEESEKSTCNG